MAFPRAPVREWDTKRCRQCGRDRVHYRTDALIWRCIGTLPGRTYSRPCGKPRAGPHVREVV